jgi:tetratricopeptide (TPR) repeat protein
MSADRFDLAADAFTAMAAHIDGLEGDTNRGNLLSALYWLGETLVLDGRQDHAMRTFEEVVHRYDVSGGVVGHDPAAASLFALGVLFGSTGKTDDELAAYEGLRRRFEANPKCEIGYYRLYATVNSIVALHQLNRSEEAKQLDRQLVAEYQASDDPEIRAVLALAETNRRCGVLERLERCRMEPVVQEQMESTLR